MPRTFRSWLRLQVGRDDRVGDFAGDVFRKPVTRGNSYASIRRYIELNHMPCQDALDAGEEAYRQYLWETGNER